MTVNPSELSRLLVRDANTQRECGYLHTLSEILQQPGSWIETSTQLAKAFETGSLRGAFVASVFVGLVDTFGKAYFPDLALFMIYLLMVVVLLTRPQGLFGIGKA